MDVSVWLHQIIGVWPADSDDPAWTRAADGLVRRVRRTVADGGRRRSRRRVFDCSITSAAKAEERARRRARAWRRAMVDADDLAPSDDDDEGRPTPSDPAAAVIDVHG